MSLVNLSVGILIVRIPSAEYYFKMAAYLFKRHFDLFTQANECAVKCRRFSKKREMYFKTELGSNGCFKCI